MSEKNVHLIKKAIYDTLTGDATLITLLKGNNIYYSINPQTPIYPAIIYGIITENDNPYYENDASGSVTEVLFNITIFSDNSKSEESDNIEARVKKILNGSGMLDDTDIYSYTCYRQYVDQRRDQDMKLWITTAVYRLITAPKADL